MLPMTSIKTLLWRMISRFKALQWLQLLCAARLPMRTKPKANWFLNIKPENEDCFPESCIF